MIRDPEQLSLLANQIRQRGLTMIHQAGLGHSGGDLSAADILAALYFGLLRVDPARPDHPCRDRFVLSKGHCAASLYATLAMAGFIAAEELETFAAPESRLSGHPNRRYLPGVEANTGPLGHGLPIAVGAALAAKMDGAAWRTYVLTGDGELQEGSNWEAAMAAAHYRLDNLTLIVDRNHLQQGGATNDIMGVDPLEQKWRAFGWSVCSVDGHDHASLLDALDGAPLKAGKPCCVIAETHKGQGVSFIRDQAGWHHRVPTDAELSAALAELREART